MRKRTEAEPSLVARTKVQVRFSEVDSMFVVWHGAYVKYLEDGREHFGREFKGLGYLDFFESGYAAPIVEMSLQYKRALRCNDIAIVEVRYINTDAAKICFEYTIYEEATNEVIVTASTVQVFLNKDQELELINPEFYLKWKEKWGVK